MRSSVLKKASIVSTLFLVLTLACTAWATVTGYAGGVPWQTGDIVVCFDDISDGYGGACNVLRIVNGKAILLDEFTDNLGGGAFGVGINNTLHVVATDDTGGSKVVVYSVASLSPTTIPYSPIAHTPVLYPPDANPYYDTSAGGGRMVRAVAFNNAGNIFVLNSTSDSGYPNIVEIGPGPAQTAVATISLSGCLGTQGTPITQANSMDLSAATDGSGNSLYAYVTSGGTIQKVTLSGGSQGSCSKFADFGLNVTLSGIKDIPPNALPATCKSSITPIFNCPTDEALLVAATGDTDPETGPETGDTTSDAVNICTNAVNTISSQKSCALLLDTNPTPNGGLTAPLWVGNNKYYTVNTQILDPKLQLQKVFTAGTSGNEEPGFSDTGATVQDNTVQWTEAHPVWPGGSTSLSTAGQLIIDTQDPLLPHVQEVSTPGVTGPTMPAFTSNFPAAGKTADGLVWQQQLGPVHPYSINSSVYGTDPTSLYVVDPFSYVWQANHAGTSGTGCCNDGTRLATSDNTVTWQDQGQQLWHAIFAFPQNAIIVDPNNHVQQVTNVGGISGASLPNFSTTGQPTVDGLTWTDEGVPLATGWQPDAAFNSNQIISDNNGPPHFQQVVVSGTSGSSTPAFNTTGGYTLDQFSLSPPPAPSVSTYGTLVCRVTTYLTITYVDQYGETLASAESSACIPADGGVTVTSPVPVVGGPGAPLGYNVYWGASGAENKQTTSGYIPIGTNWTSRASALVVNTQFAPTTNTAVSSVVWHDLGQTGGTWTAQRFYSLNAVIQDSNDPAHVQEAATGGTSGGSMPAFSTSGGTVDDDVVMWADRGALSSATTPAGFRWAGSTQYPNATTAEIVDSNNHVQLAYAFVPPANSGVSGPSVAPSFKDGVTTNDGSVIWTDEGQQFWQANTQFSNLSIIVDSKKHVQQATTQGTQGSSGPSQPNFVDGESPGGIANDGLFWTDQGVPGSWTAGASPALNAVILDSNGPRHVQQVVVANGPSGNMKPSSFSTGSSVGQLTVDGSVVWIDRGPAGSWMAGNPYGLNAVILDSNSPQHVQEATSPGTSGASAPASFSPPTGSTAGNVVGDNSITWTDEGALGAGTPASFRWASGVSYPNGTTAEIVDNNNHVQKATNSGTSGNSMPQFAAGTVEDGLIWTFVTGPVKGYPTNMSMLFSAGDQIIDPNLNLQKAFQAGTSTPLTTTAQWQTSGYTFDNTVIWTDLGRPAWPAAGSTVFTSSQVNPANLNPLAPTAGTFILDTNNNLQYVTGAGTTGPYQPGSAQSPNNPWNTMGSITWDGLQWHNSATSSSVLARYPVPGITTLAQSLALDPLIVDCTAGCPTPLPPLRVTSVITSPGSNPTLSAPGFWLGDFDSANFYKLDFASGTATQFSANGPTDYAGTGMTPCSTCATITSIQGLGVYGSEGSNQPGLARLLFNNSNIAVNNQTGYFPSPTANATTTRNSLELTLYNGPNPATYLGPFAMYASAVSPGSCFDDSTGNPSCLPTFQPGALPALPIMWKNDIPLPSSGTLALPGADTLTGNFDFPTTFQSLSNDVQLDSAFDVTTAVGLDSPPYKSPSTAHGYRLKGKNNSPEVSYGCAVTAPVISPSKSCYAGTGTFAIPIKFSCNSTLIGNKLGSYGVTPTTTGPNIQVVRYGKPPIQSPLPNPPCDGKFSEGSAPNQTNANSIINSQSMGTLTAATLKPGGCAVTQLPTTGGPTPTFRGGSWAANWDVTATSGGEVYEIWVYDPSDGTWFDQNHPQKGQPFHSGPFYVKNSCP